MEPASAWGVIADGLDRRDVSFVFHSEIASDFWIRETLLRTGRKALPASRFMGWDRFKEIAFPGPSDRKPVSSVVRSVFARILVADNAREPFLEAVVPREFRKEASRFAPLIARALPFLAAIPPGDDPELSDWRAIRSRYRFFMEGRGLREPSWAPRTSVGTEGRFILVFPDLAEDYGEYEEVLAADPKTEIVLASPASAMPRPPVEALAARDCLEETRMALSGAMSALASGIRAESVFVTLCDPESMLPLFRREARLSGVPLDVRIGYRLSESPPGRLFAAMADAARSSFAFEQLKTLLLDAAFPWKDRETAYRLMEYGRERHVLCDLRDSGGRRSDIWRRSFRESPDAALRAFHSGLSSSVRAVVESTSFGGIRKAFDSFHHAFMDPGDWGEAGDKALGRALSELDALSLATESAGLPEVPDPYALFVERLESTTYLPVSESGGILVYAWPVAACAEPDVHFILNLSRDAASRSARPHGYLRDDLRTRIGSVDTDISGSLVRALSRSGKAVYPSYADEGPTGKRPPHPAISRVRAGLDAPGGPSWPTVLEESWCRDARNGPPGLVFRLQKENAARALGMKARREDASYTKRASPSRPERLPEDMTARMLARYAKDGFLMITNKTIDAYGSCAFRRLLSDCLDVLPVPTGLSFMDARLSGSLYHEALERFFAGMRERGEGLPAATGPVEREALERALSGAFAETARVSGPFAAETLSIGRSVILRNLAAALDAMLPLLEGAVPAYIEYGGFSEDIGNGVKLSGRLDLACVRAGPKGPQAVIVDYKKARMPSRKALVPDPEGAIATLQMPLYMRIARASGLDVTASFYVSIEGEKRSNAEPARVRTVYGEDGALDAGTLSACDRILLERALSAALMMRSGSVFVPVPGDRSAVCEGCDYRGACRVHFKTERDHERL